MAADLAKRILLEFLSFLVDKIENDELTLEEMQALSRMLAEHLPLKGTADDFARFYGQSRSNVSMVLNRKVVDRPSRRVYYSFDKFSEQVPQSWRCNKEGSDI